VKKKRDPNITVLRRTARIKLDLRPSDVLPTMQAYTEAFNFCCQIGYSQTGSFTNKTLHKLTYQQTYQFLQPSQLRISAN
jgi:hypothetical protein